ncbi:hypothetical protein [Streptomyces sp. NPDC127119]|uniref:hypothetical protein n=1 Tax=Streptomyces sp. NPDC127119 TaxID=3345370 RepID=UPI003641A112
MTTDRAEGRLSFGLSAAAIGRPLMVEDLQGAVPPWPLFGPLARERLSTVGAISAFPLVEGHAHLGTADMLRFEAGPLGVEAEEDARLAVRAAALTCSPAHLLTCSPRGSPPY